MHLAIGHAAAEKRLNDLNEVRTAAWREAGYVLQAVEGWSRDGRPPATTLEDFDGAEPKLLKGEAMPSNASADAVAS